MDVNVTPEGIFEILWDKIKDEVVDPRIYEVVLYRKYLAIHSDKFLIVTKNKEGKRLIVSLYSIRNPRTGVYHCETHELCEGASAEDTINWVINSYMQLRDRNEADETDGESFASHVMSLAEKALLASKE